jgi:mercuric ion transport protein
MDVSRPGAVGGTGELHAPERRRVERQHLVAAGGILGALGASSCCIVPLILFSLGIGGAWIGNLTALAPYKPLFVAGTAGILGYGFYLVYWKPGQACANGAARVPSPTVS